MTFIQMHSLAEGVASASLQDRAPRPDLVINTSEDPVTTHTSPSQPTLLGIPQELRNKIFEYVYGVPDAANKRIKMRVFGPSWATGYTAGPNLAIKPAVRIVSHHAPPSKDTILACRQLCTEMSNMQAAAFRQYWSENTFDICDDHVATSDRFYAGSDRDMQHVTHFVVHVKCEAATVAVEVHFQAGNWIASFFAQDQAWSKVFQWRGKSVPQGLQHLDEFDQEMRTQRRLEAFPGEREILSPGSGPGFTAGDLHAAKFVIHVLIHEWMRL